MKIIVCVKAVPSSTEVRFDPLSHTIIRDGKQAVINPFDAAALECAVRIKENTGAQVTTLSMGIPDTVRILRDTAARGADEAVLLSDRAFAGADTLATSYSLACAVKRIGMPGLVICGKMAVDGDTAQIGPELAAMLGIPAVTNVKKILAVREKEIEVVRESDSGEEDITVSLPALITVVKNIADPRMPSIAGIRAAEETDVPVWTAEDIGAEKERTGLAGSATQVVRTFSPERKKECVFLRGNAREAAGELKHIMEELS